MMVKEILYIMGYQKQLEKKEEKEEKKTERKK